MRYAQGGGLTPVEQVKRETVRLEAAKSFEAGAATAQIAIELRVTERSVRRWRAAWRQGGVTARASAGPMAVEKLSPWQWQRLESELKRGPLAHGFDDEEQGWTLKCGGCSSGTAGAARCRSGGRWNETRRRSRCGRPSCGRG